MKRFLKWFFGLWLVATIVSGIYFWPMIDQVIRFNPFVAEADFPEPANPAQARDQDFEYLASVLDYDRSFSPEAQAQFKQRLAKARANTGDMSDAEFLLETRALMALADNAHSSGETTSIFRQFNRSGLDFYPFADGMFVVRAHRSNEAMLGKKLIAIDGQDVRALLSGLAPYTGGPQAQRNYAALHLLRSPDMLYAAGLAEKPDQITVTLADTDGQQSEHVLDAVEPAAATEFAYRHPYHTLRADPLPDEAGDWVRVLNGKSVKAPLTLSDDGDLVKTEDMGDGIYIRSNYLIEYPGHEVKSQLVDAVSDAPDGGFPFVIDDLRWNPGGDLGNAVPFAKKLGQSLAPDGKVFVLVGPQTFSAAIVTAALIKQYAGDRMKLVGEPMGDRMQFWAERGESFALPNSGYHMAYSTGYHDWEDGCSGDTTEHCFPVVERQAKPIGKLTLDHRLQPTFAQYAAGEDPVLDWALAQAIK